MNSCIMEVVSEAERNQYGAAVQVYTQPVHILHGRLKTLQCTYIMGEIIKQNGIHLDA